LCFSGFISGALPALVLNAIMLLECVEDGELLTITYAQVKQLYYQNPEFGFYFLQLTSARLFQDIRQLEERLEKTA